MKPEELTPSNYHSVEANQAFMSSHQWGKWCECPAMTYAELAGAWDSGEKEAFLFGGYVDCALLTPADLPEWYEDHKPAMIEVGLLKKGKTTLGDKGAKMIYADAMIQRAQSDPAFMAYLSGKPQEILTAEIDGVPWRIMVDSLDVGGRIITDLKTSKSITKKAWFSRDDIFSTLEQTAGLHNYKGLYFDQYNYFRQFAVYRTVAALNTKTPLMHWSLIMATLSKEPPRDMNPTLDLYRGVDLELRSMNDENALRYEMETITNNLPQVMRWKRGEETPPMCGRCAFCTAHKRVGSPIPTRSEVWG